MSTSKPKQSHTVQGAVPCGNPKRFSSRDVIQMTHGRNKAKPSAEAEDFHTESEKHLQALVKKQTTTEISLSGQFTQHRTFTPATSHAPATDQLQGLHQYGHYKQVEELDVRVDELRHCGLSDEEIVLKMKKDLKDQLQLSPTSKGLGADPFIEEQRLLDIEKRIKSKEKSLQEKDSFKDALELGRQSRELEKSVAQRYGKESVLPTSLVTERKFSESHPNDPVNHIQGILRDIEGKVVRDSRRDRRKRRKLEQRKGYYSQFETCDINNRIEMGPGDGLNDSAEIDSDFIGPLPRECSSTNMPQTSESMPNPDSSDDPVIQSHKSSSRTRMISEEKKCAPKMDEQGKNISHGGSKERTLRHILSSVKCIPEEDLGKDRLSEEEIRGIEKFKSYEKGTRNKVLYVKNLSKATTEEDLISLFGRFQSCDPGAPSIVFRLLTGRMKGQAFITFPDKDVASKALHLVNGYKLKDRPIIISYGKN